ncbi:TIGR04255 family protein [Pseudarthrobacter sp. NPDC089323]
MDEFQLKRPPVSRVVLSIFFELDFALQVTQVSEFVADVKRDFPNVSERPPSLSWKNGDDGPVGIVRPDGQWPFPTLVFSSDSEYSLLIHSDRLLLTWESAGGEYPGYKAMKEELNVRFASFNAALEGLGNLSIGRFQCLYDNSVLSMSAVQLATGVLTSWKYEGENSDANEYVGARLEYRHQDRTDNLNCTVAVDGSPSDGELSLWLKASRDRPDDEPNSIDGLDIAHQELIDRFRQSTSEELRREWGEI